jgi:UDP-N-acetylglucosamine 2-epimerase
MGEKPANVHVVGSPALDELPSIPPFSDEEFQEFGSPTVLYLMHPVGRHPEMEEAAARTVLSALAGERVLALHPNFDAGREGIVRAIESANVPTRRQLQRPQFVGLLKRLAESAGVLVGNSSSALIEAAALRLPIIDIGPRQAGRERANNALHAMETAESVHAALLHARRLDRAAITHPYGDGRAGPRVAHILAELTPSDSGIRRKLCAY